MDFKEIYQHPSRFLSLTTLYPSEFDELLPLFREQWYKFYRMHRLDGTRRKSCFDHFEKNTKTLPTVEDKLFFLLTYLKNNPTQEYQGAVFNCCQGKVSRWFHILLPLLKKVLKRMKYLACRDGASLKKALETFNIKCVTQDGVEQDQMRRTANDAQKVEYSGKKKDHTVKNLVVGADNQRIFLLSPTFWGSIHDKKMADETDISLPDETNVRQDLGFQGYEVEGATTVQPFKKPRGKELTKKQKWYNTVVSRARTVIENAIAGIKRCRIVKERCRISFEFRDLVMEVCTALHNLRVESPCRAYTSTPVFARTQAYAL